MATWLCYGNNEFQLVCNEFRKLGVYLKEIECLLHVGQDILMSTDIKEKKITILMNKIGEWGI